MISESAFTVQGHGVHTAFIENLNSLQAQPGVDIEANTNRAADIIHIHTVGPYSLHKLLFGRGKKVISAHVTPDSFVGSLKGAKYWYRLAKWYLRWYYNRADGVLAVSQEVVDELTRMGVRKPIYLVPNTIDTSAFRVDVSSKKAIRARLNLPEDKFVVMGSGQVQPRKRIDTFAACAKQLPGVYFVWVGGIPFKGLAADASAMTAAMHSKLPNLRFTGLVPREDVVAYYQAADLFFLPSNQETFGIVVVEAAAAGLPVLLRDIEQYRDTFKEWYLKGDDESFPEIIEDLSRDRSKYLQATKQAESIAKAYDSIQGSQRLLEVYRQIMSG